MKNKAIKLLMIFTGYLWHVTLFLVVYPYLIYYLGQVLDSLLFSIILGRDRAFFYFRGFNEIGGGIFIALGLFIILWSAFVLTRNSRFSPFQFIQHKSLKPKKILIGGPYKIVRHPMLLGYLIILIGGAIFFGSLVSLLWTVPLFGWAAYEYAVMIEEKQLLDWFGEEYEKYRKVTPAIFPAVKFLKINKTSKS